MNSTCSTAPSFRRKLPLLDRFQAIVDATYTKILKPDPRAYQIVLEELSLDPDSCVFVDDQAAQYRWRQGLRLPDSVHFDVREPQTFLHQALRHFDLEFN